MDDDTKLTLHGLQLYCAKLGEAEKNRKLNSLLDALEFTQVVIFVSKVAHANDLNRLLTECNFPSICIHAGQKQGCLRVQNAAWAVVYASRAYSSCRTKERLTEGVWGQKG